VSLRLGYEISESEAKQFFDLTANRYFIKGHKDLGFKRGIDMGRKSAFYPDISHNRAPLLAETLSARQHIVWSTGTHTHTPVFLYALGATSALGKFRGFLDSRDFGARVRELVSD
jgi:alkaline phosphatase